MMDVSIIWMLCHLLLVLTAFSTRISQAFTFFGGCHGRRFIRIKTSLQHGEPLDATTLSKNDQPFNDILNDKKATAIESFVSQLEASLMSNNDFQSFTFYGPSKKQAATFLQDNKSTSNDNNNDESSVIENMVRGCIRRVDGRRIVLKKQNDKKIVMIQVTFKYILATDIVKNWSTVETVASNVHSLLQYGYTETRQESSEWDTLKQQQQQSELEEDLAIQRAVLETADSTIELVDLNNSKKKKKPRLLKKKKNSNAKKVTSDASSIITATTPSLAHDRIKKVPLPLMTLSSTGGTTEQSGTVVDFWQALGLTNAQGQPRPSGASKIRQAQKFVEIVSGLVDTAILVAQQDVSDTSTNRSNNENNNIMGISIVDMGCGRGYLTFALHSFLTQKYAAATTTATTITGKKTNGRFDDEKAIMTVQSRGIDVRPKLVHEISTIAQSLGPNFKHLSFTQGTIQTFLQNNSNNINHDDDESIFQWSANDEQQPQHSLKVMIALHACDTATDDALWAGISGNADIIVVAPCCHQQLRPQIDRHYYATSSSAAASQHQRSSSSSPQNVVPSLLADVLRHNIYRERMTETVTDAMRAVLLELAGYTPVKVFEFVGGEHTSKNVMITAMKGRHRGCLSAQHKDQLRQRLQTLADFYGVQEHKLATWMGISLVAQQQQQKEQEESAITNGGDLNDASSPSPRRKRPLSARNMPPL